MAAEGIKHARYIQAPAPDSEIVGGGGGGVSRLGLFLEREKYNQSEGVESIWAFFASSRSVWC